MTPDILKVLAVLVGAMLLFISGRVRVDLVALMVLVALTVLGLVTPTEAVSGFSNYAVVTVWAVFILSGGLSRTGVANIMGRYLLHIAGKGEGKIILVIMLTCGGLSAFMNNVGVAALFLPVVMDISRKTHIPPSKLLMPLAFSSLMGGLTTLIGTPPNILVSSVMGQAGLDPFTFFDFTPMGGAILLCGILFFIVAGRYLLPNRDKPTESYSFTADNLGKLYELHRRLFVLRVPMDSSLGGKSLVQSRIGLVFGLNVIGIDRGGERTLAPGPDVVIQPGDMLLVEGSPEQYEEFSEQTLMLCEDHSSALKWLQEAQIQFSKLTVPEGSEALGKTLQELSEETEDRVSILSIVTKKNTWKFSSGKRKIREGDAILVAGPHQEIVQLCDKLHLFFFSPDDGEIEELNEDVFVLCVAKGSNLIGKTCKDARLSSRFDLSVLGISREGTPGLLPNPHEIINEGDKIVVEGFSQDVDILFGLQELRRDSSYRLPDYERLETDSIGMSEIVVSPRTKLHGQTLQELYFREKYGLNVLSISRQGTNILSNLRSIPLEFGDALLLYGPREKLKLLGREHNFIVLTQFAQEPPKKEKAPLALGIMALVLLPVIAGWLPIAISAIMGAVLMVVSRCLTMEEAYSYIEWRAVFLIAGMLPLGVALQKTGAVQFLTATMIMGLGHQEPLVIMGSLFLVTALGAQVMPTSAVAIIMAPIAIQIANNVGLSPAALLMTVAMSASASFMSPVAHPANVLIMGPGGYTFTDYIKVGLPLTIVALITVLLVLPWIWPLV